MGSWPLAIRLNFLPWRCSQAVKTPPFHGGGEGSIPSSVTIFFEVGDIMVEFRRVMEHIEVFLNGVFQFSADTIEEAYHELEDEFWGGNFMDKDGFIDILAQKTGITKVEAKAVTEASITIISDALISGDRVQ